MPQFLMGLKWYYIIEFVGRLNYLCEGIKIMLYVLDIISIIIIM